MLTFYKQILRFSLWGLIPLFLLVTGYVHYDPFKVINKYDNYDHLRIIPNRDYISTEMFIRNKDKYHYNSYVFGSSITLAFRLKTWSKFLHKTDHPFMFDASAESIYGIYTKLKFLDSINQKIDNVLLILDRDGSFADSAAYCGHIYLKDPRTSGTNKIDFQLAFINAYLHPRFLFSFYTYTFTKSYEPFMENYISRVGINYNRINNEIDLSDLDKLIKDDPDKYYDQLKSVFYKRNAESVDNVSHIDAHYFTMLQNIKQILEKHHAAYKVILSPLYDQIKFNNSDFSILKQEFSTHLYDFSGKNLFTKTIYNYYEPRHFKPCVGDSILKFIYK
jgi:hypothetical protein